MDRLLHSLERQLVEAENGRDSLLATRVQTTLSHFSAKAPTSDASALERIAALSRRCAALIDANPLFAATRSEDETASASPRLPNWVAFKEDGIRSHSPQTASPAERDELLRRRNVHGEIKTDNPEDDHFLKQQAALQEQMSEDLVKMAQRLKDNSLLFGDSLKSDQQVLNDAQHALQANLTKITSQSNKLNTILGQTRGNCFLITGAMLVVCVLFMFAFVWMRLFRPVS
ncbi:membrane fusion protein Use1-domain-containing protein [Chytriomyces sp. MP71]|nr:membrane fusion protein Use1-domain-containing protein [Chytriomyces sp. MP71]